ncbi:MAG: cation diffusion facilitator family transporter [Paludibacter sp.]|nr:cation diffusion facilitator family transporter [Paludibacter sp.]
MSHSHSHNHSHDHHHYDDVKNIKVAFFLNLGFTLIEIAGGFFTNSIAILSDAVHDLGDSLSLGLAWYFQKLSQKGSDKHFSYGYKRFSLLGAFINSFVLLVGSVLIITVSVSRLFEPQEPKADWMILLAIVGVIVNGAAVFRLKKGDSLNEKVVSLHLLEDVLGWAAILVGSIVMYFVDIPILDPLMSLSISVFILYNVFRNMKQGFHIILQGIPDEIDLAKITNLIKSTDKIENVHDLHIWSIDGNLNILTAHIVLDKEYNMKEIAILKDIIREKLAEEGIKHATLEFENKNEDCSYEKCC